MYEFFIMFIVLPIIATSIFLGKILLHNFLSNHFLGAWTYVIALTIYIVQEYALLKVSFTTVGYLYFQYTIAVSVYFLGRKNFGILLLSVTPLLLVSFCVANGVLTLATAANFSIETILLLGVCIFYDKLFNNFLGFVLALLTINFFSPFMSWTIYDIKGEIDVYKLALVLLGTILILIFDQICLNYDQKSKEEFEKIKYNSTHDKLTGLLNYASFSDEVDNLRRKQDGPIVICELDIDYFKRVNDTYGNLEGNNILRYFAALLSHQCQEEFGQDTDVYRFGGEEFCVIAHTSDPDKCLAMFEKLKQRLNNTPFYTADGKVIKVSFSGGIAIAKEYNEIFNTVRRADVALYHAKKNGRAQVSYSI